MRLGDRSNQGKEQCQLVGKKGGVMKETDPALAAFMIVWRKHPGANHDARQALSLAHILGRRIRSMPNACLNEEQCV
jgi:hypothetical protein